jgi:hypothetical protein
MIKNYKRLRAIKKKKADPISKSAQQLIESQRREGKVIALHIEKLRANAKQGDINNLKDYKKYLKELRKNKKCVIISIREGKMVLSYNDLKQTNISDLNIEKVKPVRYYLDFIGVVRPYGNGNDYQSDFELDSACLQYNYILKLPNLNVRFYKEENAEKFLRMFIDFITE